MNRKPDDAISGGPEAEQQQFARLRWRCRRGMRELDAVLESFLDRSFVGLTSAERARMEVILDLPDPELHAYLVGRQEPEDPEFAALFRRIRSEFHPPD